jgi:hypothetical protein
VAIVLLLAGCSGGSGSVSSPSLGDLRAAPHHKCPLPLAAVLDGAGIEPGGRPSGEVRTATPVAAASPEEALHNGASPLAAWDAVDVACQQAVGEGKVHVELVAVGRGPSDDASVAASLLLPELVNRTGIAVEEVRGMVPPKDADPGDLAPIPPDKPAALAVAGVEGSRSSAVLVFGPDRKAAEDIAKGLAGG